MTRLNYKHLYYFWTVAREGSIAKASAVLHLTPQTLSGQISSLEQAMDTPLFTKSGRSLVLTEAGRLAYDYAGQIFLLGMELEDVLKNRAQGRPIQFSVGIADVVPKLIAYRLLEPALQLPDAVRIVCYENKLENLLADLAVHKLDMVLSDSPIGSTMNVRAYNHPLGECGTSFFASREIAQRLERNFPLSLHQAPMLMPTLGTALRGALMQWFDKLEIQPHIVAEFDDSALMKAFGQAGIGAFAAPSVIRQQVLEQYDLVLLGHTDEVKEQYYAISAERRLKHPAVVAVREAAKSRLFTAIGGADT
jgi:LysR family transcriptional activator of nhaA